MTTALRHIRRLAQYNRWMNEKLYATAAMLSDEELACDRGAFFGSILATLNHLVIADTIWLKRFASHPAGYSGLSATTDWIVPAGLLPLPFPVLSTLERHRAAMDRVILDWVPAIAEADLDVLLHYRNREGVGFTKPFFDLLMHFFNHQTHHRGQITTLLSQAGRDVGDTDLSCLIPDGKPDERATSR